MWEDCEGEGSPDEVVSITYTLSMPEKRQKLDNLVRCDEIQITLYDIWNECRNVIKYREDLSDELEEFAEEIMEMAGDQLRWW